jgi:hypothetical protein
MGRTTPLRREIKRAVIPFLADKGFSTDMRHAPQFFTFRRISSDAVTACDIQWEKYGRPRFVVNFGKCSAEGVLLRGEHISPKDILPYHGIVGGRLRPGTGASTRNWFRQDRRLFESIICWSQFYTPQEVVLKLIGLFPEVEEFWASGRVGPHIHLMPRSPKWGLRNFREEGV